MKVWRFFSSSVLPLCLAFCVVFSAVVLDCVDVKAATTKTYPNADIEKSFRLAGNRQSFSVREGSTSFTYAGKSIAGGASTDSGTVNSGSVTYYFDITYSKSYSIDQLDPTHWYKLALSYNDAIKDGAKHNTSQLTVNRIGKDWYVIVGGQEYSFGSDKSPTIFIEKSASSKFTLKMVDHISFTVTDAFGVNYDRIFTFKDVKAVLTDLGKQTGTIESKLNNIDNTSKDQLAEAKKQTDESKKQTEESKKQTGIMSGLLNKITTFFNNFFSGLINALVSVFVPEDGYFKDYFDRLNKFFSEKLGMLYAPIDMFVKLLNGIKGASGTDTGIVFPGLKWEDTYIIPKQTISLSAYSKQVPEIQQKIYFVTDIIMVGAVLLLLQNKLKEVLTQ